MDTIIMNSENFAKRTDNEPVLKPKYGIWCTLVLLKLLLNKKRCRLCTLFLLTKSFAEILLKV